MPTLPYLCTATPLTAAAFQSTLGTLGIDAATLWAMLAVETPGCGFFADCRPQVRFERRIFSEATGHQYDAAYPTISNMTPGYSSPDPWAYLAQAVTLDQPHALASASWGLGQMMGKNYPFGGYASVEDMVAAMCASEDNQLAIVVGYIMGRHLATALQNHDWATYASGYNGVGYQQSHYDIQLANAYAKFSTPAAQPNLDVRAAQIYLHYIGYNPNGIDGQLGPGTLRALNQFQSDSGYPPTQQIDAGVLVTLVNALPTPVDLSIS